MERNVSHLFFDIYQYSLDLNVEIIVDSRDSSFVHKEALVLSHERYDRKGP